MRITFNSVLTALPIVCLVILSCSSGSNEPASNCGSAGYAVALWVDNSSDAVKQSTANSFAGVKGSEVSVSWSCKVTNVCAHMHSDVYCSFNIDKAYLNSVHFKVVVWYGILKERPINLARTDVGETAMFKGEDNFGIRDVYGDGPGEYHIFVDMFFPSTGHWDTDSAFVDNVLSYATVETSWHKQK